MTMTADAAGKRSLESARPLRATAGCSCLCAPNEETSTDPPAPPASSPAVTVPCLPECSAIYKKPDFCICVLVVKSVKR
eukprot:1413602-Pleurochrysis_carterae.AAC.1